MHRQLATALGLVAALAAIGAKAVVPVCCVATYTCDGAEIVDAGVANCRQMR